MILVGLKPELIDEVHANLSDNHSQIQSYLNGLKMETLAYSDLEWRVDIKVASRSLRKCVEPEVMLKLNLKKDEHTVETHILQTDVVNLCHLTNSLEEALNEIKTNYCRRIFRNIV